MVKMSFNPFQVILDVFNEQYPGFDCQVNFVSNLYDKEGAYGVAEMLDDGGWIVAIDVETPIDGAIEVLAHELAHVAAGPSDNHGKKWNRIFTKINDGFNIKSCEMIALMEE